MQGDLTAIGWRKSHVDDLFVFSCLVLFCRMVIPLAMDDGTFEYV